MIEHISIYLFVSIMLLSAIGVVTIKNIFRAALSLGVCLLSIAGLYLLMGAEFLAAVQVLVYIGGILTLIIFAIMFTKDLSDKNIEADNGQKLPALLISASILAILIYGILNMKLPDNIAVAHIVDASNIGGAIFLDHVLAFEILSVILLIALVGAIVLAKNETNNDTY